VNRIAGKWDENAGFGYVPQECGREKFKLTVPSHSIESSRRRFLRSEDR
jgi:hypothetical protein